MFGLDCYQLQHLFALQLRIKSKIIIVSYFEKVDDFIRNYLFHLSGYGNEFYAYYIWNSLSFFTSSLATHTLVNGLLYDTSSITGGYFINNVQNVSFLSEYCTVDACWSVHVASLLSLTALLIQICSVFVVKKILFKTKYYSDECISMSYYNSE